MTNPPPPTLDSLADEAHSHGEQAIADRFHGPVLVVVAPDEEAEPLTAVRPGLEAAFQKPMLPPFVVEVKKRKAPGKGSPSDAARVAIGRVPICDIVLRHPSISKVHAYLAPSAGGTWTLQDAGSTNGILFEKRALKPGEQVLLRDSAVFEMGDVRATFYLPKTFIQLVLTHVRF